MLQCTYSTVWALLLYMVEHCSVCWMWRKHARASHWSSWKKHGCWSPAHHTLVKTLLHASVHFVQAAVSVVPNPEVVCYYIVYGNFNWYIWQCPLFSRCPLLEVSVNGEFTVYSEHSSTSTEKFVPRPLYVWAWHSITPKRYQVLDGINQPIFPSVWSTAISHGRAIQTRVG